MIESQDTIAPAPTGDVLAIENAALAAENAQLKSAAQSQKLTKLLGELRFLGKLTPGLEQAGVAEILAAAWELETGSAGGGCAWSAQPAQRGQDARAPIGGGSAIRVTLPDGSELPLGEAIANLLYAIPPSWGGDGYGVGAHGHAPGQLAAHSSRAARADIRPPLHEYLPPRLSPQERDIARTLGLTAEEYIGITAEG
jgi:hypothetical protein